MADEPKNESDEDLGKSSKKKMMIMAGLGLLVLLLVGGGAAFFLMKSGGSEHGNSNKEEVVEAKGEPKKEEAKGEPKKEEAKGEPKKEEAKGEPKKEEAKGEHKKEGVKEDEKKSHKSEEDDEDKIDFGETFSLKPFHINLGNPLENRYIRLELSIEYRNGETQKKELEARLPQLRDAVISVASRKTREFLLGPDGKDQLRLELLNRMNQYMDRKIESVYIVDILIE
jgi:flagellar FliL protein